MTGPRATTVNMICTIAWAVSNSIEKNAKLCYVLLFCLSKYIIRQKNAQPDLSLLSVKSVILYVNIFLSISFNICIGCSKELSH